MVRFFEILAVFTLLTCGYCASQAVWSTPGTTLRDVPKNVRQNPASYRSHYRHFVYIGGK